MKRLLCSVIFCLTAMTMMAQNVMDDIVESLALGK